MLGNAIDENRHKYASSISKVNNRNGLTRFKLPDGFVLLPESPGLYKGKNYGADCTDC